MAFPEDVITDILSRLPVKSLLRFGSVCKEWEARTKDPPFISKHNLKTMGDPKNEYLLVKRCSEITGKPIISLISQVTHNIILSSLEIPSIMDFEHLNFVGSCNGLLCIALDDSMNFGSPIALWNPAIKEFRVLPDCLIGTANVQDVCHVAHGFGYHPLIDDYKVVRVVYYLSCSCTPCRRAEVYSQKLDCWREIDCTEYQIYDRSCTALNGALYWIAYDDVGHALIITFDVRNEVFGQLQLPNLNFLANQKCTKLVVLKGSLYLIAYTSYGFMEKLFYVWKMDEHDGEMFWENDVIIGPLGGVTRPVGYGLSREIYLESGNRELVSYNPSTHETKNFPTGGRLLSLEVQLYLESLVSTNAQNEV